MPFCNEASGTSKVAFLLMLPAFQIHCAGYGTMYWMKTELVSGDENLVVGLWKMRNCTTEPCLDLEISDTYMTPLMYITRGLMSIPIVLILLATIIAMFYVTSPGSRGQSTAAWIMMLLYFSVGATLIGIIIWSINKPSKYYIYWSAGLTLIAAGLCVISATLMIQDIRKFDYAGVRQKQAEKRLKKRRKKEKREERARQQLDLYDDRY